MNRTNPRCLPYIGFGIGMLVILSTGLALGGESSRGRCQLVPETWSRRWIRRIWKRVSR